MIKVDEYKQVIGQNLEAMRRQHGYSQEYLSDEAEISLSNYRDIEHGRGNPTIETLGKIANTYGVYIGTFFDRSEGQE